MVEHRQAEDHDAGRTDRGYSEGPVTRAAIAEE